MKFILALKPFYGKIFENNRVFTIDNGHNIFFGLDKALKKHGIEIVTIDTLKKNNADKYIYCDVPYPWEYKLWWRVLRNRNKNILFCFDSPIITPFSHMRFLHFFFSKIYTWDDSLLDGEKYFKLHVPQFSTDISTKTKPFKQKDFLVLINAKKSTLFLFKLISKYRSDLYKERLKAINFFERYAPDLFSLYGRGWRYNECKTYMGEIPNGKKIKMLSNFKFCICFENTIAPGYITEKIFDCFKARCVPIYWGAPNIEEHMPRECFIDFREFMDYGKLLRYLHSMSEKTYNEYIEAIEKFLSNPDTRSKWFEEGFRQLFLQSIS